jgi:DNA processing protein
LQLSDEQRFDWLRLIRSENVGPRTFRALLNQYGSAAAALEALPDLARKAGRLIIKVPDRAEIERELVAAQRMGVRFIATGEADYPRALMAIDTAPPILGVRGDAAILRRPMVAVVGSRNASTAGLKFTEMLAHELGLSGFVVVSGLARGIDTRAHRAALQAGTVAVMAGGQDKLYPPENQSLADRILEQGGAILTEMPMGWEPRGRDFPRRNRIVSGLSLGTVVVEAARRSGSLITARFALEQGREVFAVPGSPLDPRAEGPNDLIRQGATLCGQADHVCAALLPLVAADMVPRAQASEPGSDITLWDELELPELPVGAPPRIPAFAFQDDEGGASGWDAASDHAARRVVLDRAAGEPCEAEAAARILDLLGPSPQAIDDLVRAASLPARSVHMILLDLELAGQVERHQGGGVSRIA